MKRVVKDIMNPRVVTVIASMDLREVAKIFVQEGISGAPVVDDMGQLVDAEQLEAPATMSEAATHCPIVRRWVPRLVERDWGVCAMEYDAADHTQPNL
ncbi:MAG: CBS domain-containing protein [Nitrospinae bacterium]|nr:CBS domain-containing protein [Nitrospinota bacterium]